MLREKMKRAIDIILSLIGIMILFVPILLIALIVRLTSEGPAIHWSKRYGKNKCFFLMPKFRTMNIGTPQIDTLSLKNPKNYLTPVGSFLRKTSIDELPQLFSVLIGKMSLVGPRPALFTQTDLIDMRDKYNINDMTPGITGYSQIKGRDDIDLKKKLNWTIFI